ncbi:MAG TPA: tail fiber domain-containing protein, partial [Ruminiclostridium sp.]|nr:tail fiber domain-containing protein [Ruminiclostridium sp.]
QSPNDDKLEVTGTLRILSQSNPLRFTSAWSGLPNNNKNCAEISNDTSYYKALMIVGNQSAGQGRKVAIWDRLDVNGFLYVNGNMQLSQALTPSAGSGRNGIIFPSNPGGGAGDSAWLKYYARSGEACSLEIGTSDNTDDNIALMATGNVGIGTLNPSDKLDVNGWMRVLSGSNPLRFTSSWSGFPDQAINNAEICNDTSQFKSLMIVGNRSGGSRKVSIWDKLDVNGNLQVNGDIQSICAIIPSVGSGENNGIMFPKNYYGGSGDAAWIRYYSDTSRGGGENMTLEIGISNDPGTGGYYGGGDRIRLYASGGVYIDGYFYYSSSRDLKENITALPTKKAKEILDGMNPVSFNFKGDNEKTTLGFIAEEVPNAVAAKDKKAISPMEMIAVLTSVVKDQKKVINKLQQDLDQIAAKKS